MCPLMRFDFLMVVWCVCRGVSYKYSCVECIILVIGTPLKGSLTFGSPYEEPQVPCALEFPNFTASTLTLNHIRLEILHIYPYVFLHSFIGDPLFADTTKNSREFRGHAGICCLRTVVRAAWQASMLDPVFAKSLRFSAG